MSETNTHDFPLDSDECRKSPVKVRGRFCFLSFVPPEYRLLVCSLVVLLRRRETEENEIVPFCPDKKKTERVPPFHVIPRLIRL